MALRDLRQGAKYGNYTPTLTGVANLDAVTLNNAFWAASGDLVTVHLHAQVDPTAGIGFSFRCSLPFGPVFAAASDIIGCAGIVAGAGFGGAVIADVVNQEALIDSSTGATAIAQLVAQFAYIVR